MEKRSQAEGDGHRLWLAAVIAAALLGLMLAYGSGYLGQLKTVWDRWWEIETERQLDFWIMGTAALAAMACAIPGCFLIVRRQSMMGDALSHTALPGVVLAFMTAEYLRKSGFISDGAHQTTLHLALFLGSLIVGVLTALVTELIQKLGKVESSASLGVVFTSLFALGLFLVRVYVDDVHLDPDCVLNGQLVTSATDADLGIPPAARNSAIVLGINLLLVVVCFKELKVTAFDPALATTMGINAHLMHYLLMGLTAATVVSAFESVGSILVIAMLIAPAATAYLLTDRLSVMIGLSLGIACVCAVVGHVFAITLPAMIFNPLGEHFAKVSNASSSGAIAATSGLLFLLALLFGRKHGLISKALAQLHLQLEHGRIELLQVLLRLEESSREGPTSSDLKTFLRQFGGTSGWFSALTIFQAVRLGEVARNGARISLTPTGRDRVSSTALDSPLWEAAIVKHFSP